MVVVETPEVEIDFSQPRLSSVFFTEAAFSFVDEEEEEGEEEL